MSSSGNGDAPEGRLLRLLENPTYELTPLPNALNDVDFLPPGASVSVTARPKVGLDATVSLCEALTARGYRAVPHIAARLVRDRQHLAELAEKLGAIGVDAAFVIAGDAPERGEYFDSVALLRDLERVDHPFRTIGVAGYPEGHPHIPDDQLLAALSAKQARADYVATQVCFHADAIRSWVDRLRRGGIDLPVKLGIVGDVNLRRLAVVAARIGVGDSVRFLSRTHGLAASLLRPGRYTPTHLLDGLLFDPSDNVTDIEGLHIYTFNDVKTTERWRTGLIEQIGSRGT